MFSHVRALGVPQPCQQYSTASGADLAGRLKISEVFVTLCTKS